MMTMTKDEIMECVDTVSTESFDGIIELIGKVGNTIAYRFREVYTDCLGVKHFKEVNVD